MRFKVLKNFKTSLITGKTKFFERGSFFEISTNRPSTLTEIKSRLRTGFIRELVDIEKPKKKVEKIKIEEDKKEVKTEKKKSRKKKKE